MKISIASFFTFSNLGIEDLIEEIPQHSSKCLAIGTLQDAESEDKSSVEPILPCNKINNIQQLTSSAEVGISDGGKVMPSAEVGIPDGRKAVSSIDVGITDGGRAEDLLNMLIQGLWLHGNEQQENKNKRNSFCDQFVQNQLYQGQSLSSILPFGSDMHSTSDKLHPYSDQGSDRLPPLFGNSSMQPISGQSLPEMLFDCHQGKVDTHVCSKTQQKIATFKNERVQEIQYSLEEKHQGLADGTSQKQEQLVSDLCSSKQQDLTDASGYEQNQMTLSQILTSDTTDDKAPSLPQALVSELPPVTGDKDLNINVLQRHQIAFPQIPTSDTFGDKAPSFSHTLTSAELPSASSDKDLEVSRFKLQIQRQNQISFPQDTSGSKECVLLTQIREPTTFQTLT